MAIILHANPLVENLVEMPNAYRAQFPEFDLNLRVGATIPNANTLADSLEDEAVSAHNLTNDLCGIFFDGPNDLVTNPKWMDRFGTD